jgi:hypothetical protein
MKTYTAASIFLLGLTVAAAPAGRRQSGQGLSMLMTMTMNSPQFPKPTVMMMSQIRFSSSGKGRGDWLPTDSAKTPAPAPPTGDRPPLLRPGTYSLSKKGNDTTLVVDPAQKKVWVMLKSDNAATAATAQSLAHDEYVNVDVSAQRVQPDTTIAGIAVQHWRIVDNHTQRVHSFGSTTSSIVKSNYEIYSAPAFDLGGFNPASSMGALANDSVYGPKLRAAMIQAMPGLPLMMRTQMQILDNKGKAMSFSMAMLVSNISRGDPPASIFVVPAGYTTVRASFAGAPVQGAGAAPGSIAGMPHGDTTHRSLLDTVAKQSGTNATNSANQAIQQKIKSAIHFP